MEQLPEISSQKFPGRTMPFETVRKRIEQEQTLWQQDRIVESTELQATPQGEVVVPEIGPVTLTPWSRRQLAMTLGIRWDRWFQNVSGEEAAEEINRRFTRTNTSWKLRTRDPRSGEQSISGKILAALVSPSYAPIADDRVFASMQHSIGKEQKSLRFCHAQFTDRSTHIAAVSTVPVEVGGTSREIHYPGFYIRNSQVGFSALTVHVYFLRLVCTNGLLATEGRFRLLYRMHRPIEDGALDALMDHAFSEIPSRWQEILTILDRSMDQPVGNLEVGVANLFRQVPGLNSFREPVMKLLEPKGLFVSRFLLIQAMTEVAKSVPDPDQRFDMQRLAGKLLVVNGQEGKASPSMLPV